VKRYEGLFILNTAGKEEGVNELVEKLKAEITAQGAAVETVQKMEKKAFVRVADNKRKDGYYVNFIFSAAPAAIRKLQTHFALNEDVFRTLFSELPHKVEAK
jgi:ribosomal protein S6